MFRSTTILATAATGLAIVAISAWSAAADPTPNILVTPTATTENRFAAQLEFTIRTGVTQCANAGFGLTGSAVYSAGDLGSTEGAKVIGDSLPGQQAGDRLLAGKASEVLCAQILCPRARATSSRT